MKTLIHIQILVLIALGCMIGYEYIPDSYKPWTPIDLKEEVNLFTSYKLGRLKSDFPACQAALEGAGVEFTPLPDRTAGQCDLTNQINLVRSKYPYSAAVRGRCALLASLILWENQVVDKAAHTHLDSDVARINHFGIFSCRNIAGSSRRSQHATANAIDIAGFTLENGKRISVVSSWGKDTAEGRFLREVRDGACGVFRGVLGPDYNAAHADHFHFDLGSFSMCR